MTEKITAYYNREFKESFGLIGLAIINFTLGLLAIAKWGDVGAGILVMLGGFAIYQVIVGLWILFVEQTRTEQKVATFENNASNFLSHEIKHVEKDCKEMDKKKNYLIIAFLVGMLFLCMGGFGGWSDLSLGIGAGLSLQSAIMLILLLLSDYRASFYLQVLKKHQKKI